MFRSVPALAASLFPLALAVTLLSGVLAQQQPQTAEILHTPLDEILDVYVRDGLVYYRALKLERRKLDAYVAALDSPGAAASYASGSRDQQAAFWINAYNAFVLTTVIDRYPIDGTAPQYPSKSLRQIPGAFERLPHRAAGRRVTLDEIEKAILSGFRDPRLYLALGRGAVGSGRLRSEAYTAARLERQLTEAAAEFARRNDCIYVDPAGNRLTVSPIVGWHEAEFIAAYAGGPSRYAERSPIERAVLAFIEPHLLPAENEFLAKNAFRVIYHDFDWRLNDLTGGRP